MAEQRKEDTVQHEAPIQDPKEKILRHAGPDGEDVVLKLEYIEGTPVYIKRMPLDKNLQRLYGIKRSPS